MSDNNQTKQQKIHHQLLTIEASGIYPVIEQAIYENQIAKLSEPYLQVVDFIPDYLSLPDDIIGSLLPSTTQCFAVHDRSGKCLPQFMCLGNPVDKQTLVNQVLSKANALYQQDKNIKVKTLEKNLNKISFLDKLGNVSEKTERIYQLSQAMALWMGMDLELVGYTAKLAKIDLSTELVKEFPSLRGIFAYHILLHAEEPSNIATAVKEHYYPHHAKDELPTSLMAEIISIADKLDTLVGFFALNRGPSHDKDPFALKRQAHSILRILIEKQLNLDMVTLIHSAVQQYRPLINISAEKTEEIKTFFFDRLKGWYLEVGVKPNIYDSVYVKGVQAPYDFHLRIQALREFILQPESNLLRSIYKRIHKILEQSQYSISHALQLDHSEISETPSRYQVGAIDQELLQEDAEDYLVAIISAKAIEIDPLLKSAQYSEVLKRLTELNKPIEKFFDEVKVMCEDELLRINRLTILSHIKNLFIQVADFSKL